MNVTTVYKKISGVKSFRPKDVLMLERSLQRSAEGMLQQDVYVCHSARTAIIYMSAHLIKNVTNICNAAHHWCIYVLVIIISNRRRVIRKVQTTI